MKALFGLMLGVATLALVGCGGDLLTRTATITGTVVDVDFNPVRDAEVTAFGTTVRTTNTGSFTLTQMPEGDVDVLAQTTINGTRYRGRTLIVNSANQQQGSVNIVVGPESQLATIRGTVRDADGFLLTGASVFAYLGSGSSQRTLTDRNGEYILRDVIGNTTYTLSASGRTFRSDQTTVTVTPGTTRTQNFILRDAGLPFLNPPQNIGATSWVAHPTSRERGAVDWVKQKFDPRDRQFSATNRSIRSDMSVETELFWDRNDFGDKFGVGVYRAPNASGSLSGIDLYFDPLAPYYVDIGLNPSSTYSYALTTISALYPEFSNNTESALSNRIVVDTLNLLNLTGMGPGIRFNWANGSGAQSYIVYLFDQFPTAGVNQIWDTESNPTTGLGQTYTGPALQAGRTYYYVVLGVANGNSSRTISKVGSFIP